MLITINGNQEKVESTTLQSLVSEFDIDVNQVAVEHNGDIIPRTQFGYVALSKGDTVELVEFVGGG